MYVCFKFKLYFRETEKIQIEVNALLNDDALESPISSEITGLRSQQEALKGFKEHQVELANRKEQAANLCKMLIQSADSNVETKTLVSFLIIRQISNLCNPGEISGRSDSHLAKTST